MIQGGPRMILGGGLYDCGGAPVSFRKVPVRIEIPRRVLLAFLRVFLEFPCLPLFPVNKKARV